MRPLLVQHLQAVTGEGLLDSLLPHLLSTGYKNKVNQYNKVIILFYKVFTVFNKVFTLSNSIFSTFNKIEYSFYVFNMVFLFIQGIAII